MGEHTPTPWQLIEANEDHGSYILTRENEALRKALSTLVDAVEVHLFSPPESAEAAHAARDRDDALDAAVLALKESRNAQA